MDFDFLGMIVTMGDLLLGKKNDQQKEEFYLKEVRPIKFSYRPQTLNEYIGQEKAKELVLITLQKINEIKPCHILITGSKGHGKSTLAQIIANHLHFPITYQIGGTFTLEALRDFIFKNEKSEQPMILFIDETHNLEKKIGEFMYPILEDFILPTNNAKIRPFIFIGATTEKFTLLKKFAPLVDRCGAQIQLEHYKPEDIKEILRQYNAQVYQKEVSEETYDLLAHNSRLNPRTALSIFDDYIVCNNAETVLRSRRIIRDSLTDIDITILEHLKEIGKPIGEETLAIIAGIERADFKLFTEPFIIQQGYMSRTGQGRVITQKGKDLVKEIKCLNTIVSK
jgi:Holliday junction DNA helicase RuvB